MRKGTMRARATVVTLSVLFLTAAALVGTFQTAFAATSEAVAIGLGSDADGRVLEVTGTADNSPVLVSTYQRGLSGDTVNKQRWTLELTLNTTDPEFIEPQYRLRNVLTGKCLAKKVGAETVVTVTCGNDSRQQWVNNAPPSNGVGLANANNGECLEVVGGSAQSGAATDVGLCRGSAGQSWKVRYSSADCQRRSNQRIITAMCISSYPQPMFGAFGTWHNNPVVFDPDPQYAGNSMDNYLTFWSRDAQNADTHADGVEYGLHSEYDSTAHVQVYNPYWLEWGNSTEQYHSVNGDITQSSMAHNYMVLSNANNTQWDLLYDFNRIGGTVLQEGGRLQDMDTALAIRYPAGLTIDNPFDNRVQTLDGANTWHKPVYGAGRSEPKTCQMLPTDLDPLSDVPNLAPSCLTTAVLTSTRADGVTQIDAYRVGKPGTAPSTPNRRPAPPIPPQPGTTSRTLNGVDQNALQTCMHTDAARCLADVPGLASCVAARLRCNATQYAGPAAVVGRASFSRDEAQNATASRLALTRQDPTRRSATMPAAGYDHLTGDHVSTQFPDTVDVHVVSGDVDVRGLAAADATARYHGYLMVYSASTGLLLSACLGANCPRLPNPAR